MKTVPESSERQQDSPKFRQESWSCSSEEDLSDKPEELFVGLPQSPRFVSTRRRCISETVTRQEPEDPWDTFHENIPSQTAKRYRYHVSKQTWVEDQIEIKLDQISFDRGAMRACYRLKKRRTQDQHWSEADDYVAKKYIEKVHRSEYFEDVRLQMQAKLWADSYNAENPPKLIDMNQICVFELENGDLYHMEKFIQGKYIKYNSNSGFVEEQCRFTPHAFSHFTFVKSGHSLMVVDIQGVQDFYTDPQIHTSDGQGYGDGNLGTRGMALFFHSHKCNDICHYLNLPKFELSEKELLENSLHQKTTTSTTEVKPIRSRASSFCQSEAGFDSMGDLPRRRERQMSENLEDSSYGSCEGLRSLSQSPVGVYLGEPRTDEGLMGSIHLELARLHESGRFGDQVDSDAIRFHLEIAADFNNAEAARILALFHTQGNTEDFTYLTPRTTDNSVETGVHYMIMAAELGDMKCMLYMARAFETGLGLGERHDTDWKESTRLYELAIAVMKERAEKSDDKDEEREQESVYRLMGRVAGMYRAGGHGLHRDSSHAGELYSEAAELAMADLKGKLATEFFQLAEDAWSES